MRVQIERAQLEITSLIREGDRYRAVGDYENALRQFEEAEFKIKSIPYNLKAMKDLLPRVEEYIRRTREANIEAQRTRDENQRALAVVEAAAYEQARKREVLETIAHLLEQAYMAFDQRRFDKTIKLCDEVISIDPHYTVAVELKEDAQKVRHREEYYDFLRAKVENWKKLTDQDDEAVIPYADSVVFPDAEQWAEISKRSTTFSSLQADGGADDPEILAINRQLDTIKMTLDFQNQKLEDMVAYIREFTGLNIFIEQNLGDKFDPTKQVTFRVRDIVLRTAMRLMLDQFELDYTIDESRIIKITTRDKAGGRAVPELHDIRDILVRIQDFAGPKVELTAPGGAGAALAGASFTLEEPKESSVSEEQIVDLIKDNVAPGTWEGEYTIEKTPNQQLIVNHTPKVHKELQEFLKRLRRLHGHDGLRDGPLHRLARRLPRRLGRGHHQPAPRGRLRHRRRGLHRHRRARGQRPGRPGLRGRPRLRDARERAPRDLRPARPDVPHADAVRPPEPHGHRPPVEQAVQPGRPRPAVPVARRAGPPDGPARGPQGAEGHDRPGAPHHGLQHPAVAPAGPDPAALHLRPGAPDLDWPRPTTPSSAS
jgi:tetratricopeptide (TPR) repeat protein